MELPWCNGLASARGLARLYQPLACGGRVDDTQLISQEALAPLHERQSWSEMDEVLRKPLGFAQGFIKEETQLFSPNKEAFGHPGAGGCLGFADPKLGLSIGYVCNRMDFRIRSPRALALCHALYDCVDRGA
jgi:CubicO group peptidase (beta-lactamase class C family)